MYATVCVNVSKKDKQLMVDKSICNHLYKLKLNKIAAFTP